MQLQEKRERRKCVCVRVCACVCVCVRVYVWFRLKIFQRQRECKILQICKKMFVMFSAEAETGLLQSKKSKGNERSNISNLNSTSLELINVYNKINARC